VASPAPRTATPRVARGDFTRDTDLTTPELERLLLLTAEVKRSPGRYRAALAGQYLGMLFEKPSLRTRVETMRTFIFGAGASVHAGYPLARDLGKVLVPWAGSYRQPGSEWIDPAEFSKLFPCLDDFEEIISELESPTRPEITKLTLGKRSLLLAGVRNVICAYFDTLGSNDAELYRRFAEDIATGGDVVITFNYDVRLERELRRANKWEIGNGYGFELGLSPAPPASPITVLKLQGSTNWNDLLFGGSSGFSVVRGDSMGVRPVILPQDFAYLDYRGIRDPEFPGGRGSVDRSGSMILPGRTKVFAVETSVNPKERKLFWDSLWRQAAVGLKTATEIVVVGYSLPVADERARKLILSKDNHAACVRICSGNDTGPIRDVLTKCGFKTVTAIPGHFEDWLCAERNPPTLDLV